jgi:hypothetical protein
MENQVKTTVDVNFLEPICDTIVVNLKMREIQTFDGKLI